MRRVLSIIVVSASVFVAACGATPTAPRETPAGIPTAITMTSTRSAIPFEGADVVLAIMVTVQPGTKRADVEVDVRIRSDEGNGEEHIEAVTNLEGAVVLAVRLMDSSTITARAGSVEISTAIVRSQSPSPPPTFAFTLNASLIEATTGTPIAFSTNVPTGLSIAWDFDGDGETDALTTTPSTTWTFEQPGAYRAVARVTYAGQIIASTPITISVSGTSGGN